MNPALEPALKLLRTPVGKLVLLVGGLAILVVVAAIEGNEDRRHPTVFLANVFSVPLEARAGAQTVTVPSHGSASIKLDDPGSPIRIVYQGSDVDRFSPPYTFGVLNILGAAPIVRQKVVWAPSPTESSRMLGTPSPPKGDYCGARVIDPMDADDILRAGPSVIVLQAGASTTEIRERLYFPRDSSPWDCIRELEQQRRQADARAIRGFADVSGDLEAKAP
jgi:hypothetical protein